MRKIIFILCITTLSFLILGCQPKPDYSKQEKLVEEYFTYVANLDEDSLKTIIYNKGSSLYNPNILQNIYDLYEDYLLSDPYKEYKEHKENVDTYFKTFVKEYITSYEITDISEYEYEGSTYYTVDIDANVKQYEKMPGEITHFSNFRYEFKQKHKEEIEKIYNEQGLEAADTYSYTQASKEYFQDGIEKIKSASTKQITLHIKIREIDDKLYITDASQDI